MKTAPWVYFLEARQRCSPAVELREALDDAATASDTADRWRNLGLVVLEHRRQIDA